MTPYLLSWMTPFLAWKVWLLHVSDYLSHSITIVLILLHTCQLASLQR